MANVFISYAREDKEFVGYLNDGLKARGKSTWVDWEGIPPSADWRKEISAAIEAADTFVFVISPDSAASEVCSWEVTSAIEHNKRLVPIVRRDADASAVVPTVAAHNWIFFRENDDFDRALETLVQAIDLDLEWVHEHTRLLTHAMEWDRNGRDGSFALHGKDLHQAERRLAEAGGDKEPRLMPLQIEYVLASRASASRRSRVLLGSVILGLFAAAVLSLMLWQNRQRAQIYLSRDYHARAVWALADNDVLAAEVLLARSLTLDEQHDTRERFLESRVRGAPLAWISPRQEDASVLAVSSDARLFALRQADGSLAIWNVTERAQLRRIPRLRGSQGMPSAAGSTVEFSSGCETLCVAFSPDGQRIASGHKDGGVVLSDARTGRMLRVFNGHRQEISCLAFSKDGQSLASGSLDRTVRVWDVATGNLRHALAGHVEPVTCVDFSPDGRRLASGSWDHHVILWDVASGRLAHRLTGHEDQVLSVAFSPDGRHLASGSWDTRVWLWDVKSGQRLRPLIGHRTGILCMAFRSDGQLLVTGEESGHVRLWDMETGQNTVALRGHPQNVRSAAFTRDGRYLLTGSEGGIARLWDLAKIDRKEEVRTLRGHTGAAATVAVSPDGSRLASGSEDLTIRIWDAHSGEPLQVLRGHRRGVSCLAYSPDGKRLATGSKDGTVRLWDAASGRTLRILRHNGAVRRISFRRDGKVLASSADDGKIWLWDVEIGVRISRLSGSDTVLTVAWSQDGRRLVSGNQDGRVRVWDMARKRVLSESRSTGSAVWDASFSPDGRFVASGSEDGVVRLWRSAGYPRQRVMRELHAFGGHEGPIWDIAFSPDGRSIASGASDSTLRLWDVETFQCLTLRGYGGAISWVAFSPDGARLAGGSQDRTVRIWNLPRIRAMLAEAPSNLLRRSERETGLRATADAIESITPEPADSPQTALAAGNSR